MNKILIASSIALSLSACSNSSGVFQIGNNTYQVSTRATWELGGREGAKEIALRDATKHCQAQNKTLHVINSSESYGHFEGGTVDLTFSCE
jgi:hypothetical protein